MAQASAEFGPFSNDILIANFGDGTINAFNPVTGDFVGQITDAAGSAIVNPGLRGIVFGASGTGDPNAIYFTSGVAGGPNLFGAISVGSAPHGSPQISGISPNYGAPAAVINIAGTNFGASQGNGHVTVGGAVSDVTGWTNTAITIRVPSRASTGEIVVTAGGEASNGAPFTFHLFPAITGISEPSGGVGSAVTIVGANLLDGDGNGVISFNGILTDIISQSETAITVDVPSGATSGPIRVHVNGITVIGPTFTLTHTVPQVSEISPNYGAPAAVINIAGTNFGATQGNGFVTVSGAISEVTAWSNTAITIRVPSRASTGDIVVTSGGEASNGAPFTFHPFPAITGISEPSGGMGSAVTIVGANLLDGDGNGVISFNGTLAHIISQSETTITVDVPSGAISGPIRVHVNGITVISPSFTVTDIVPSLAETKSRHE